MILPILTALISAAPALVGLFENGTSGGDGSTAAKVARVASEVARSVTGKDEDGAALKALEADPALLLEYQRQTAQRAIALYGEETKRLQAVNETIRAEAANSDPYVRRMRPTMGYALILSWSMTMAAVVYVIVTDPGAASAVIVALADLSVMWSVALSVLGLYVYKRSEDKKPGGGSGRGLAVLGRIARRVAGD
ncbi:3TM-type holin [Hwanghaeella sp.]|uniref:3TM-type holin n=1 Tax=Hwanghaeella sp. TaxID=2605943 RepID=UPI003CCBFACA